MYRFAFLGTGNMGGAIARAVCESVDPTEVILANKTAEKAASLAKELSCSTGDNTAAAKEGKYIFIGVKPQILNELAGEISTVLAERKDRFILVSMAAGVTLSALEEKFGKYPIIRIMPNMPVSCGAGTTVYCHNDLVNQEELCEFEGAMKHSGKVLPIEEKLIDAASALSGCGPAFVYMFIQALSDGGVDCGLPRELALELAVNTVIGSGITVDKTELHPDVLKDMVCSPGGSTIEGVYALERGSLRADVMDAVICSYKKTILLGK